MRGDGGEKRQYFLEVPREPNFLSHINKESFVDI